MLRTTRFRAKKQDAEPRQGVRAGREGAGPVRSQWPSAFKAQFRCSAPVGLSFPGCIVRAAYFRVPHPRSLCDSLWEQDGTHGTPSALSEQREARAPGTRRTSWSTSLLGRTKEDNRGSEGQLDSSSAGSDTGGTVGGRWGLGVNPCLHPCMVQELPGASQRLKRK